MQHFHHLTVIPSVDGCGYTRVWETSLLCDGPRTCPPFPGKVWEDSHTTAEPSQEQSDQTGGQKNLTCVKRTPNRKFWLWLTVQDSGLQMSVGPNSREQQLQWVAELLSVLQAMQRCSLCCCVYSPAGPVAAQTETVSATQNNREQFDVQVSKLHFAKAESSFRTKV